MMKECIGVCIDVNGARNIKKTLAETDAEKYVEVRFILDGERKDFTLDDFKTRLGFIQEKSNEEL